MKSFQFFAVAFNYITKGYGEGCSESINGLGGVFSGPEKCIVRKGGGWSNRSGRFASDVKESIGMWYNGKIVELIDTFISGTSSIDILELL